MADDGFARAGALLAEGRRDEAVAAAKAAAMAGDAYDKARGLGLLRAADGDAESREVLDALVADPPSDPSACADVAMAVRNLGYPMEALSMVKPLERDDRVRRIACLCLADLGEHEEALAVSDTMESPAQFDRLNRAESLCALGEFSRALDITSALLAESPDWHDARRAHASVLLSAGREKEAVRFARDCLKDKSAGSNALIAYVMYVIGNEKAAAGYSTRALKLDSRNVPAMEVLGRCLAARGETDKVRVVAGAINEVSPGDRRAMALLDLC